MALRPAPLPPPPRQAVAPGFRPAPLPGRLGGGGEGTRARPFDLSAGQSRTSIPKGAYYLDPRGNLRRNDNVDQGNPIILTAAQRRAAIAAGRSESEQVQVLRKEWGKPDAASVRKDRTGSSTLIEGYSGLADEIRGAQFAARTAIEKLAGRDPGYSVGEAYEARRALEARRMSDYRRQYPVRSAVEGVGGAIMNPLNVVAGEFIAPARAGSVGRAALAGGAMGAGYGAAQAQPGQRLRSGVQGGVTGAVIAGGLQFGLNRLLPTPGSAVGGAPSKPPKPPSDQRLLSRQGVELTPGQMLGGGWQRAEDAATSIPVTGDAIRDAQLRGLESFNQVTLGRVVSPIGGSADDVGRAGVRDVTGQVSDFYERTLAGVQVEPDDAFTAALAKVEATPHLPGAVREELGSVLGDVRARLEGPVDGRTWKMIDADLSAAIRAADSASANSPSQRLLRNALIDLRKEVQALLGRADPQALEGVRAADEATAMLARLRQASQYTGTAGRGGLLTPSDLNRAVQGMDTSAGNRAYAQGEALLQDLSEPAMRVLPRTVPDSGTPFRSIITGSPQGLVVTGVTGIPASILYSPQVQSALNALYRATDSQGSQVALEQLTQLARQQPALVPLVSELLRHQASDPASPPR